MKFSIIICTYNSSKSLSKTLDSVFAQNCKDYEVLIVDGSSTDGTLEIIKNYEEKFEGKLKWKSEPDNGVYDAMNKGIDLAMGDWIYFLGSDDVLFDNEVLNVVSSEIENSDAGVIYGNVQWGNSGKIYDGKFSAFKLMEKNICQQAVFYKKTVFRKFGKFDLKYPIWADYVFNIQCFGDRSIGIKYTETIIATYGTEGFSSGRPDGVFGENKENIFKRYFPEEYAAEKKTKKLNETIEDKNRELAFMQSSKYWKLREWIEKAKINIKK